MSDNPEKQGKSWVVCPICFEIVKKSNPTEEETLRKHLQKHTLSLQLKHMRPKADAEIRLDVKQNDPIKIEDSLPKKHAASSSEKSICPLCEEEIEKTNPVEAKCIYNHLMKKHPLGMKANLLGELGKDTKAYNKCVYCEKVFDLTTLMRYHILKNHREVLHVERLLDGDDIPVLKRERKFCGLSTIIEEDVFSDSLGDHQIQQGDKIRQEETSSSTTQFVSREAGSSGFETPEKIGVKTAPKRKPSDDEIVGIKTDVTQQHLMNNFGVQQIAICSQPVLEAFLAQYAEIMNILLAQPSHRCDSLASIVENVDNMSFRDASLHQVQSPLKPVSRESSDFGSGNDPHMSASSKLPKKK